MSLSLHRQVVVAFAQQIAAGLGVAIEQNALDPATVTPGIEKVLVQGDGAEPPRYQDVEGIKHLLVALRGKGLCLFKDFLCFERKIADLHGLISH